MLSMSEIRFLKKNLLDATEFAPFTEFMTEKLSTKFYLNV